LEGELIMNEQEIDTFYLDKLRLYFTEITKVMKHLEDTIKPPDKDIKDPAVMGIKAMCESLYLCLYYINQISIVASPEDFIILTKTIEKLYIKYHPLIIKLQTEMGIQTPEEFKEKGLNFVGGNTTLQ